MAHGTWIVAHVSCLMVNLVMAGHDLVMAWPGHGQWVWIQGLRVPGPIPQPSQWGSRAKTK